VVVNGDVSAELDETLRANLQTPSNATIADPLGMGTILNDDASAGGEVQFLTATSRNGQNKVEWVNPNSAPYVATMIRFRTSATPCTTPTYPADVHDGTLLATQAGGLGAHDSVVHGGVTNGTTYCYSAFAQKDALGSFSAAKNANGLPFDTTGPVKWAFDTGAAALAPTGINGFAYAVSNDRGLYALTPGAGGGDWPAGFIPFEMVGPSQSRPTVSGVAVGSSTTRTAFVSSQDGHVYAVNAVNGAPGNVPLWTSPALVAAGGMLQASASAMFTAFGGAHDLVLVGTRDGSNPNSFYGLNLSNGTIAWEFDNSAGPPQLGNGQPMGMISGPAVVDYPNRRVYFASYEGVGGADTLWCVEFDGSSARRVWARALGHIDGSPVLRTGRIYVGTNGGLVHALDANTGADLWAAPFATDGTPVKGFVWPVRGSNRLYASTSTKVWAIDDDGAAASSPWSVALTTPSPLLHTGAFLFVGTGDGRLYQIDGTGATRFVVLGDGSAVAGSPSMDFQNNVIYIGTTAGQFYAVSVPLP
jgi:outer membrane protein assembly factor BamB